MRRLRTALAVLILPVLAVLGARMLPLYLGRQLPAAEPPQMERILEINALRDVTKALVEAARESLVIGQSG